MSRPVLVSLAMGLPGVLAGGPAVPVLPGNDSCAEILAAANVTGRFAVAVAHGIHDITVEDLREFKGDVPCAGNGVPTVNRDLRSESAVLPSAPCLDDGDSPFATPAMRVVDAALTRMDDMNYDIGTTSGLQRLVHAFHMREVWALASAQYQALAADPPGRAACACALDVDGNGVLEELRLIASSLRSAQMASSRQLDSAGVAPSWLVEVLFATGGIERRGRFARLGPHAQRGRLGHVEGDHGGAHGLVRHPRPRCFPLLHLEPRGGAAAQLSTMRRRWPSLSASVVGRSLPVFVQG